MPNAGVGIQKWKIEIRNSKFEERWFVPEDRDSPRKSMVKQTSAERKRPLVRMSRWPHTKKARLATKREGYENLFFRPLRGLRLARLGL